jgi:hypothetical protein
MDAGSVDEVIVGGVSAGLAVSGKNIIISALLAHIITLPEMIILSVRTRSIRTTSTSR